MRHPLIGQKWHVGFTDPSGNKNVGFVSDYRYIPLIIEKILHAGGRDIIITDKTFYKDDENEQPETKDNVIDFQSRR